MTVREHVNIQIETLPEHMLEKVHEFLSFLKFSRGLNEEYLEDLKDIAEYEREKAEGTLVTHPWEEVRKRAGL